MATETATLPPLSPSEYRTYSHMADTMTYYHNHFKKTYTLLHTACVNNARPANMSMRAFLSTALDFVSHLTIHHTIEEQRLYPILAQRMPMFKQEMELLGQHKEIHIGLEKLEAYVRECKLGKRELRLKEMGELLDGFGGTLLEHLDEEVERLSAEEMRRYWSLKEMEEMPM